MKVVVILKGIVCINIGWVVFKVLSNILIMYLGYYYRGGFIRVRDII